MDKLWNLSKLVVFYSKMQEFIMVGQIHEFCKSIPRMITKIIEKIYIPNHD